MTIDACARAAAAFMHSAATTVMMVAFVNRM
jgi:hypothetical protein